LEPILPQSTRVDIDDQWHLSNVGNLEGPLTHLSEHYVPEVTLPSTHYDSHQLVPLAYSFILRAFGASCVFRGVRGGEKRLQSLGI